MKIIQVGAGGFGRVWLKRVTADAEVEYAGLVDVSAEALAAAREETGVDESRCFSSLEDALGADLQADAVVNVTPPATHREVAEKALEAGLHVLTEKPLAGTLEDCRAMVQAANDAGKVLMVSQNYRFAPWARTIRRLLREQVVGKPGSAVMRFKRFVDFRDNFRETMPYPLLIDMSIHHFDLMRYLLDANAVSIYTSSWRHHWSLFKNDASASVCIEMDNGVRMLYDASWASRGPETPWDGNWEINCTDGQVRLQDGVVEIARKDEIERVEKLDDMPATAQGFSLLEFRRCIEEGREPETSGRDNLGSVGMVFAAVESARINERVDVNL